MRKEKRTIFLNTHNLDEAQRICDKIGILKTKLLKIGTPQELEASLSGRKTVVQLDIINDAILGAVRRLGPKNVMVEDSRLVIDVVDPPKGESDHCRGNRISRGPHPVRHGTHPEPRGCVFENGWRY